MLSPATTTQKQHQPVRAGQHRKPPLPIETQINYTEHNNEMNTISELNACIHFGMFEVELYI